MIDYSRFQLGVDYGPLSQSIQNFGNTMLKKREMEMNNQIAKDKLAADQQLLGIPKQYPTQFGFGAQPVIDEYGNIYKPIYKGQPGTNEVATDYQPFAISDPTKPMGKNLQPWYPKVGETKALADPAAEAAVLKLKKEQEELERQKQLNAAAEQERQANLEGAKAAAAAEAKTAVEVKNAEKLAVQQGLGGIDKAQLDAYSTDYKMAAKKLAQLPNIEKALNSADTGKWSELSAAVTAWIPGSENEAAAMQNLNSLLTSMAGAQIQLNVGVQTDMDFLNALRSNVQAGNTPEANRMIISRIRNEAEYDKYKFDEMNKAVEAGVKPRNFRPDSYEEWFDQKNKQSTPQVPMKPVNSTMPKNINELTDEQFNSLSDDDILYAKQHGGKLP